MAESKEDTRMQAMIITIGMIATLLLMYYLFVLMKGDKQ